MTEEERERWMLEIHARRMEPGIVLEWHQVEMRRRYELEWEHKNEIARQEQETEAKQRFMDETPAHETPPQRPLVFPIVTVYEPIPEDPLGTLRQAAAEERKRRRLERREFIQEIRLRIDARELREFREYLKNTRRRFPKNWNHFGRVIAQWRRSVVKWNILRQPQSFWEMEMVEHSRMAYLPPGIHDRPFSKMMECSIWTGTDSLPAYANRGRGRPPGPRKVKVLAGRNAGMRK